MSTAQKILEIEAEMERTQKNKATSYHLGLLKAKLAKLKREMIEPSGGKKGGAAGEGFEVSKAGDARVGMIGFPSVGKSTLLTKLTGTQVVTKELSLRSQHMSSQHWPASQVFWSTREPKFSCWIYLVSSKEQRMVRVEVVRSLLLPVLATWLWLYSMQQGQCNTRRSYNTSCKASESD